ncbi:MAG: ABC transporter ATP-binding protein [Pseudomonadota bacterium]
MESLHCGYGHREVLTDVSFRLNSGEMLGVLGPNGAGKSSLVSALAGVVPIWSGVVKVGGTDVGLLSPRNRGRRIACVPQKAEVSFPFKCFTMVLMGRYPYLDGWGAYSDEDADAAGRAMEETRISHLAGRPIGRVSGGEAQTVTIARALAQQTDILLLDEATSNLDAAKKIQVFDLLAEKNRRGTTILCVMHDINLAAIYCNRLLFLKQGRIVQDGPTEKVFTDTNLSEIYETEIRVTRHPVTGSPQAHFVPMRWCGEGFPSRTEGLI